MDPIIFAQRLKLTLITKAERESPELEWLHELRSNEQAMRWSIFRKSESIEDTEKVMKQKLPTSHGEGNKYRIAYAVHEILDLINDLVEGEPQPTEQGTQSTQFIGLVTLTSLEPGHLVFPQNLTIPDAAAKTTLTVELAYSFLPIGWGKGYATESLKAVLESCKRARSFWTPFSKVYIRVIVNEKNPASLRVMAKAGVTKLGVWDLTHKPFFLGGEWRERSSLHIFGMHLLD